MRHPFHSHDRYVENVLDSRPASRGKQQFGTHDIYRSVSPRPGRGARGVDDGVHPIDGFARPRASPQVGSYPVGVRKLMPAHEPHPMAAASQCGNEFNPQGAGCSGDQDVHVGTPTVVAAQHVTARSAALANDEHVGRRIDVNADVPSMPRSSTS